MIEKFNSELWDDICAIKEKGPLVHNISNLVVINFIANGLLASGASPIMAHALEEIDEIVSMAGSVVLNIGTLDNEWLDSIYAAANYAAMRSVPLVLDPVGAGVSRMRTEAACKLIKNSNLSVLRGNASEIMACHHHLLASGTQARGRGVDAAHKSEAALVAGQELATTFDLCVVISGKTDFIINSSHTLGLQNGDTLMTKVTGMGCLSSALVGAFLGVQKDRFNAAAHAMSFMGVCGELAARDAAGPASFAEAFLDKLHNIQKIEIEESLRLALK